MISILLLHSSRKVLNEKDNLFAKESLVPSLGLASVASYCRENGITPKVIDLRLNKYSMEDVFSFIREHSPVLVGLSAFTTDIAYANETAKLIKEKHPALPVAVGGPHPSLMPERTLEEYPYFDIAVAGEGERTTVELAKIYASDPVASPGTVGGIAYRKNGKVTLNHVREMIENLNDIPFPAWDLFDLGEYNGILPLSASRGCPYRCYFCTPLYLGGKVRVRSHESILAELKRDILDFGAKRIQFSDAMMGLRGDELAELCRGIIAAGLKKKFAWDCETRADSVEPQLLAQMKEAGCEWVALGVESGNERILREVVKKSETKEQVKKAVSMIRRAGLKARCFFIIGHCTETVETIRDTIAFALELDPDALSFGLMVPNPGSEIRALAERGEGGLKILHDRWEDYQQFDFSCMESSALPLEQLKKWQANAYLAFYARNPGKALQMFFSQSAYNYNPKSILKLVKMLIINKFRAA